MRKIAVMVLLSLVFVSLIVCNTALADSPNHDGEEYRKYGQTVGEIAGK